MNSTLSEQITAIQKARRRVSIQLQMYLNSGSSKSQHSKMFKELCEEDAALNNAGSTIYGIKMVCEAYNKAKKDNVGAADHAAIMADKFFKQLTERLDENH